MGFVTPMLLGGAALVAVPIVLHLIMRREAQKLKFPALRFVQRRRSLNQHRLRLRHWLLLALRCAIIAGLAIALARPTLRAGTAGHDDASVATVLVFDNSLRMTYQHENQSRLERAQDLSGWLLQQLPVESLVTVIDRSGRHRGQDLDRSAAELRIERLDVSANVRPLGDALRDALQWLAGRPDYRGEIYVFTDLAAEAWPDDARADFATRLAELPGANVYLIDVGIDGPRNLGLGELRLSSEQLAPGGLLRLETELLATDAAADGDDVLVELYVGNDAAGAEKRGEQVVAPTAGQATPVEFALTGLELGTHQGYVRIVGSDPLVSDDVRYFTVDVRPPTSVLLAAESSGAALFLREAIAPTSAIGLVNSRFDSQVRRFNQLENEPLADFAAVLLIDPPPLADRTWQALVEFADAGGGVGVFLGRNARRDEFNQPVAQQLLPTRLRWQSREATYLRPVAVEHPALGALREFGHLAPWSEFPVFKYWELEAGSEEANVVATFANGRPALVERLVGGGRVVMMTTSVSDPAHADPWNLLPTGSDPWPFLVLANGITDYLAGIGEGSVNYQAGQTVVLRLAPEEQVTSFVLQAPGAGGVRQSLAPGQQELTIAATEALGNYRVRAGGREARLDRGFSVNLPAELSRLERVPPAELVAALGGDRTRVARTREEIEVRVGLGRTGRELFPALIVFVALVLGAEQLLANRFYRTTRTDLRDK